MSDRLVHEDTPPENDRDSIHHTAEIRIGL